MDYSHNKASSNDLLDVTDSSILPPKVLNEKIRVKLLDKFLDAKKSLMRMLDTARITANANLERDKTNGDN